MADVFTSSEPFRLVFELETTFGSPPADGAAWDTAAESSDGYSVRAISADFSSLREGAIEDPDLWLRQSKRYAPIKGLRSNGEIPVSMKLYGSEAETTGTDTIAETALAKILQNAFGGISSNNRTTVTGLSDQTTYDVNDNNAFAAGQIFCLEDTDDTQRLWPIWIEALNTDTITAHKDLSGVFTIANSDVIHPAHTFYFDPVALDRGGSGYETYSILFEKNGQVWVAMGCHLRLESIAFTRGQVPVLNLVAMTAGHQAPGDGAPTAPTWTSDPEGGAGLALGIDTYCHLQDYGTATHTEQIVYSATVTPGIEITKDEGLTGSETIHGVVGYRGGNMRADIDIEVPFNTDHQDDWDTQQAKTLMFYQVTDHGEGWAVHAAKCYHRESPEPMGFAGGEPKRMMLRLSCVEDTANTPTTALGRSPLHLAIF